MGALANYRRPGDDYYKSLVTTLAPIDRSDIHIAKKPKLSLCPAQRCRPLLLNSIASKVANYPDRKSAFLREVHAPVRNSRVGHFSSANRCETAASSKESTLMGKFSFFNRFYVQAWAAAHRNSQYESVEKEKEKRVIEVDSDERDDAIDDASIEELKIVNSVGCKRKIRQKVVEISQEQNLEMFKKELRSSDSSIVTNACNAVVELDDGDKIDFMQLDLGSDDSGLAWYRELQDRIGKKYDGKLQSLNFEIERHVKGIQWNQLLRPQKKEEQIKRDVAKDCFMPLTEKEKREVSAALSNSNRRKILVTHENSNIDITGEKLQCLRPRAWLNDEVINLYLELLKEREKREPKKFLKCHFFNTFFYKKLISGKGGYNYPSVRRWTTHRKLGYYLLECDKIFVPIHKEVHWCLAIINQKDQKFQYLDSLGGVDTRVLNVMAKYFVDEVKDKCGKDINFGSWEREFITDLPQQANGFDCGVFMIKYADFCSSRGIGPCFSQENMPYFRRRTAKEILQLKAD